MQVYSGAFPLCIPFAPNPIIAVNNWVWCGEGAWVFKRCEKRIEFPHLFATFAAVTLAADALVLGGNFVKPVGLGL